LTHISSLKKLFVLKYVAALLTYSIFNLDSCSDIMAIHRRPSVSCPPKLATKLVTILKIAAHVVAAATAISPCYRLPGGLKESGR
jgi:hypothetical protein